MTTKGSLGMSTSTADGSATTIHSILKKPSKVLTVGVEYAGIRTLSATELSILSMQLRKCKVSAIWCQSIDAIKEFAAEQQSAQGNFPGPCPVIYHGPPEGLELALQAGASAVVVSASDREALVAQGEIIWRVTSKQDIDAVVASTGGRSNVFWVDMPESRDEAELGDIVAAIPPKALWMAAVEPMQADGAEIAEGKAYKNLGCGSIVAMRACVGDSEDLEYTQFLVGGLTSKASSEFKFSGLTGSTNGHFGGVQSNSSVKWRRPNV